MERLPNILSTIRILLTPVFLVLFFEPELWIKLIALGVYIIAAITDFFDGYYARKYNIETSIGAFLDPFADKLLTLSGFAVLPFIAAAARNRYDMIPGEVTAAELTSAVQATVVIAPKQSAVA